MECQAPRSFGCFSALPGLPIPLGFVVVWSSTPCSRAFDQLARGPGHGLPTNPSGLHCDDSDHYDGALSTIDLEGLSSTLS